MDIARKMALGVLTPLFIILLFTTALDVGFVKTATNPATIKRLISESGIYNTVVPNLLQQAKTIETGAGNISAADPAIQKAASQAITPAYIKQNAEATIDSVYKWLDGKTPQPDFVIDLSTVKNNFASNFATEVQQRLAALPPCTAAQNYAIAQSGGYNAVNATCLPRGTSAAQAAEQLRTSLASNGDFLEKPTLSAATIKNEGSNQSVFSDQLKDFPKQYQRAKKTPLILSILTILAGMGIVFLSGSWQKGLRRAGIFLGIVGVVMMLFAWGLNRGVSAKVVPSIKMENAVFQQDVRNLVTDLVQQIDKNYWFFGILYTVVGAAGIAAGELFRRRAEPAHETTAPTVKAKAAEKTSKPQKTSGD